MTEAQMESFLPEPISDETFAALTYFFQYDLSIPLSATTVETIPYTKEFDVCEQPEEAGVEVHHTREKIVFSGGLNTRVPGQLAFPVDAPRPLPCVLVLDGIGGSKDRWWQKDGWPRGPLALGALFDAGYAVFAIDAQYHGERIGDNNFEPPGVLLWGDPPRPKTLLHAIVQSTVECRRALDYLETRAEIDPQRIGVMGQSMGGMMTFALSGIEPRVKAAVSCVVPMMPRQRICPLTPHHFATRNETVPLLMLMGREDEVANDEESEYLFEQIKTPEKKRVLYDSGHRLPPEYVPEAVSWFDEYLK